MERLYVLFIVLLMLLLTLGFTPSTPSIDTQIGYRLVRVPIDVYSMQPVLVFAYVPSGRVVELEIYIHIGIRTSGIGLSPPFISGVVQRIPMVPIPWASKWYMAYI